MSITPRNHRQWRRALAVLLLLSTAVFIPTGCSLRAGDPAHHITLGDWTTELYTPTFVFCRDSARTYFDGGPPRRREPVYQSDPIYYALLPSRADDPHGDRHIALDHDSSGQDLFYFDANNNEDLTDDGPPLRWTVDRLDTTVEVVELNYRLVDGTPRTAYLYRLGGPEVDEIISNLYGCELRAFHIVTKTARYGWWAPVRDSFPVEFYATGLPGTDSGEVREWYMYVDVDRDGRFFSTDSDLALDWWGPVLDYGDYRWEVEVAPGADYLTLTEIGPAKPATWSSNAADGDSTIEDDQPVPIDIGPMAPVFDGYDLDSNYLSLDSLRGKMVVLDFWGSRCIWCRAQMSILNKMLEKYNDRATFVSFTRDSRAGLMHFRDEFDFDYHIIPEAAGAFEAYGVDEGPVHVLIDRNGKVVFAFQGTRSHLDRWIGARIDSAYHLGK